MVALPCSGIALWWHRVVSVIVVAVAWYHYWVGWDEGKVLTVTIIHKQQQHHHHLLIGCHVAINVAPWTLIVIVVAWPW